MQQASPEITAQLAQLPKLPGVYLMKDRGGSVLYVGKAKNLKSRVRSYFQRIQDQRQKVQLLVAKIAAIETIVTPSEKEALILENTLIKKYRPRFNVSFRDDKNYPYLRLSLDEPYPTLTIARQAKPDSARYFGPFASSLAVRETLKLINLIFPIRKCHGRRLEKKRPCIYYQLGQCPAPCCCMVDPEEYKKTVRDVQFFLQGRSREVIVSLKKKMELESQSLQFEQAARTRDRLQALEQTLEKQSMVGPDFTDRDVFSFFREGERMEVVVLFVRGGRLSGTRSFTLNNLSLSDAETLSSFLAQYYDQGKFIPREVIIPCNLPDQGLLAEWLRETRGGPVKIVVPVKGVRGELLKMAAQNAGILFRRRESAQPEDVLYKLQEQLGLKRYPQRIACFDISNIMGTAAVGSAVLFADARPDKTGYRRFRIRTVQQADDYAMMYEVLSRYLARAQREKTVPDLIMVDGGRGQLGVLIRALEDSALKGVDAISLAKAADQGKKPAGSSTEEEKICLPQRKNPLILPRQSPVLLFLQRIRDEAHRFAVTYHRQLKARRDLTSPLQDIPGVGKKTAQQLLRHFGSIERLQHTAHEELSQLCFLNKKTAALVYDYFHQEKKTGLLSDPAG